MKTKITVTVEDITSGVRDNCSRCPVSLAIARQVGVQPDVAYASWYANGQKFVLSDDVADRIYRYDETGKMEPFEFETRVPA